MVAGSEKIYYAIWRISAFTICKSLQGHFSLSSAFSFVIMEIMSSVIDWMSESSQNPYVEAQFPNVMVYGGEAFER